MNHKLQFLTSLLIFCTCWISAQTKILITDEVSQLPISNANILCGNRILGKTNTLGIFEFSTNCKEVIINHENYQKESLLITQNSHEVSLSKKGRGYYEIDEIVVSDKSDPKALEILRKVNKKFKENSPQSLSSYEYKSFQKFKIDFDKDSIDTYRSFMTSYQDSLRALPVVKQSDKEKKDSISEAQFMNSLKENQLFMWERATEHLYSSKYGEKVNLLDNRVSGVQQPIYELVTLRTNLNKIPKEVNSENETLYRYYLTDSIDIDGRENFVILFRERTKNSQKKRKFNGYIYIDQETFAIKKIESNANNRSEGTIVSTWTPIQNKWFLLNETMKIYVGSARFDAGEKKDENGKIKKVKKKFGNYAYLKNDFFDFKTPVDFKSSDFSGYTYAVKNSDGSLLNQYRRDTLSAREAKTYVTIDSIGKEFKLDQKVALVTNLFRGYVRTGKVDWDIIRFLSFNNYEGVRLGAGLKLNEHFNKYISPEGYVVYGFKDKTWKYGAAVDFKTTLNKTSFFRIEYADDVISTGKFNQNLWTTKMRILNSGVDINNERYFSNKSWKISYENDLSNSLTMRIAARTQESKSNFEYRYKNLPTDYLFKDFGTILTLKYSPYSKNIMTPTGKYTYEQGYPEIYFNYEKAYKALGGEYDYHRFDVMFLHIMKTTLGKTGTRIYAGLQQGEAPIYNTFEMGGLDSPTHQSLANRINVTSYLGFATMPSARYFNDRFVGYYLTHRLPWNFKLWGKKPSSIDLVYKGIIGDFKNQKDHQFDFNKMNRLFQEVGFEYNNIFDTGFNIGFFYKVGHYSQTKFVDNIGFQLKLDALGF